MPPQIPQTFSKLQLPPINKKSQTSLVEMVLLLTIAVLFYWFVVSPKKVEQKDLEDKLSAAQAENTKIQTQKEQLSQYINDMKSNPDAIEELDKALPLNGKVMILNLWVEKLAADAGVTLENVFFNAASDAAVAGNRDLINDPFAGKRTLKKITGSVSVQGQPDQVQSFLKKMEASGRVLDLSDIQITAGSQGEMLLGGNLTAYYFAP